MLRSLVKLILILVVVVAAAAFFLGYRWAGPSERGVSAPATAGTSGTAPAARERAREVGAEIGEKVAVGANAAERALSNGQLTAKIKAKMTLDDTVKASAIDVDTDNGVVTLSGKVDSAAQRQRAVQLARETAGVKSVIDHLQVR